MSTIDKSLEELELYIEEFEKINHVDYSESDTRSKVIDRILLDVLGWKEEDIVREGHVEAGYFDYKISLPGFHMIVEAKKQKVDFTLPTRGKLASINSLMKGNSEVINQIRSYAVDAGIQFGVITNGRQFIIGEFLNYNATNWKNNRCLFFDGLEEVKERFIEFYNNLSRDSIIENGGKAFLSGKEELDSNKIISNLVERDREIIRNNMSGDLVPLFDRFFGEIFDEDRDDEEFIKECFVSTVESKKNRGEIERMFEDNPPQISTVIPAKNTRSIVQQIEKDIQGFDMSVKESAPPKPIIVIGSKGAGKSTFINYLFKSKLDSAIRNDHLSIYIDFRKYASAGTSVVDQNKLSFDILGEIFDQYSELMLHSEKVLKRIYFKEIKRKDEGVWRDVKRSDPQRYKIKLVEFLEGKIREENSYDYLTLLSLYLIRERRKRLILVIDNADQFNNEVQQEVFLYSNAINRSAKCGIFVSLREGYYYKWRNSPPFDAFENSVYHVTAPKYEEVLQKRIDYTLFKLKNSEGEGGMLERISKSPGVIEFLSGVKNSLFGSENQEMVDFLNYTTFPNIREGLMLFKLFLISGYTNVQEYIQRELFKQSDAQIVIPIHEFVKAIGLNNKLYYNHDISVIRNLFYPADGNHDHFLKCWILKYLLKKVKEGGISNKFEDYAEVLNVFVSYGFSIKVIQKEIIELIQFELIESEEVITDIVWTELPHEGLNICITSKGRYYIDVLKNKFHYLDLVLQDTPIYSSEAFNEMKSIFPKAQENGKRFIFDRKRVVEKFLSYLEKQEENVPKELISSSGSLIQEINDNGLTEDIARIEQLEAKM